jgi:hypothetical protein
MTDDRFTRRRMVQVTGGIAAAGLAGCLDSGGGDDGTPTDEDGNMNTDEDTMDGGTTEGG